MAFDRQANATIKSTETRRFFSETLDGSTTTEIIALGLAAGKVSWQSTGDLAGNIEFSIDGKTFFDSTAFTAGTPASYSTHNVTSIRITRTGGSGRLAVAAN